LAAAALAAAGCTSESTRIAIEAQQRADAVEEAVFARQHEALRILLYRDVVRRLGERGVALSADGEDALNAAWNERDLLEFWALQHERARALRLVGVDAHLYGEQAAIDILLKWAETQAQRWEQGLIAGAAAAAAEAAGEEVKP